MLIGSGLCSCMMTIIWICFGFGSTESLDIMLIMIFGILLSALYFFRLFELEWIAKKKRNRANHLEVVIRSAYANTSSFACYMSFGEKWSQQVWRFSLDINNSQHHLASLSITLYHLVVFSPYFIPEGAPDGAHSNAGDSLISANIRLKTQGWNGRWPLVAASLRAWFHL